MRTKTITLYSLHELSKEAQEKAHRDWVEHNDYPFLSDYMNERLHELLVENGIKDTNDTSKPGTKPTPVLYSLSHCQGDGAIFEGVFEWKDYQVRIKHVGNYCHSNSKTVEITDMVDGEATEQAEQEFEEIYQKICKELERNGYNFIEQEDSFENFEEICEANDYTFRENGEMENV